MEYESLGFPSSKHVPLLPCLQSIMHTLLFTATSHPLSGCAHAAAATCMLSHILQQASPT